MRDRDRLPPVAEVLLFHHAQGLTGGCLDFAERLHVRGHVVHTPDLYEGNVFPNLEEGMHYAEGVGFDTILERGRASAESLPADLVYAGLSLGVLPAQMLAQTRRGAKAALLVHSCIPTAEFGGPWPQGIPVQIHLMEADEWVLPPNEDLDAARQIEATVETAKLYLYPGERHLFTDNTLPDYDEKATTLLTARALSLLDGI